MSKISVSFWRWCLFLWFVNLIINGHFSFFSWRKPLSSSDSLSTVSKLVISTLGLCLLILMKYLSYIRNRFCDMFKRNVVQREYHGITVSSSEFFLCNTKYRREFNVKTHFNCHIIDSNFKVQCNSMENLWTMEVEIQH